MPGSTLTREADFRLMLGAGPEKSVLSTKTFMAKLAYLLLAAGALDGDPQRHAADACRPPPTTSTRCAPTGGWTQLRDVAHRIADRDHLFLLGRGLGYPMALEGALKIKEVTYIHAEGFAAGELKHGVIALIEPGTPCLRLRPRRAPTRHTC